MADNVLYQNSPPMFRNNPLLFLLFVVLILAFGLGLILLLWWYVVSKSKSLTITDEELRYEVGILNKQRSEIRLSSIRSVRINQSFWQRIFGTGDLDIFTAGDNPEVTSKGMPDPGRIRELT